MGNKTVKRDFIETICKNQGTCPYALKENSEKENRPIKKFTSLDFDLSTTYECKYGPCTHMDELNYLSRNQRK